MQCPSDCATFRDLTTLGWAGLGSIASCALAGFGFVKCWVRLARKVRFARRRAAFFLFFGIGELGLPSVLLLGDARYGSVSAEFRAFAAHSIGLSCLSW